MDICVNSYSFNKLFLKNKCNQLECIAIAKEIGFDCIEFSGIIPHDGSSSIEYAKKLKAESDRVGLPVVNFVFGADFINGFKDGKAEDEVSRVKKMVDIAEILGASGIRHDVIYQLSKYPSFDLALEEIANAVREVTIYAQGKGIKTMVENHGIICQDALRVEKLFNKVNHENFGVLCDIGNFLCVDENPINSVSLVMPYTFFVHAKDFYVKSSSSPDPGEGFFMSRGGNYLKGAIIGHGDVPVKQCLQIMKKAGYNRYISVEFEGMEEPLEGIRIGLNNLKRYIEEVGF